MKLEKIIVLMAIMSLLSLGVYAETAPTCSITLPAANTAYTGVQTFIVAVSDFGDGTFNVTGVNVTVAGVVVGSNMTEGNINESSYNLVVDTATITDVKQTTVTANVMINGSSDDRKYSGSCTSTGVDFDQTDPVCDCGIAKNIVEVGEYIDYDCTDSTDTTTLTTSCILTYHDSSTETETDTNGIFEDTFVKGEGTVACTVTDEVSKTNTCSDLTVTVKSDGEGDDPAPAAKKRITGIIVVSALLIMGIGGVIAVAASMKKKKGKRK